MGKFIETRLFKLLQNSNYTKSELNMSFNNLIDELIKCYSSNSELHQAYKETQRALYFLISLESEIKRDKSSNEEMIQHRLAQRPQSFCRRCACHAHAGCLAAGQATGRSAVT